jgi:peptide/nickel transport system permease protein
MIAFILRRLLQGVIVMLVVGFIAFSLFNFVGDPVSLMLPPEATQADREQMRSALGLDKPFYQQFATFLGNAVQGNFGISLRLGRPVSTLLVERLPATLELAITAALIALFVGIPVGVYTALQARLLDLARAPHDLARGRVAAELPHRHLPDPDLRRCGSGSCPRSGVATP